MTASLIITLRETLEIALIVGIVLAYLNKTENFSHRKYVWWAVVAGTLISVVLAVIFQNYLGGFEGRAEEIYEGITMFIAAGLLTWMILWMLKQRTMIKKNLESKVEAHLQENHPIGIFVLVLVGVLREGIETVIFLQGVKAQSGAEGYDLPGALMGIVAAILIGYILFKGIAKVPLKQFFTVSSVILILFAAGLFAHGIHEFEEAGLLTIYVEHLWDVNWFIDEKGTFGSILKGIFGYNGNPSLLEVAFYWVYLVAIGISWRMIGKKA